MFIPTKLTEKIIEWKDGKPSTSSALSDEAKKINEIIEYLEQCEQNVLITNQSTPKGE